MRFATPAFIERELGIRPGPPLPYLAASEIEVADLDRLAGLLAAAGLAARPVADGVALTLPPAIGGTIVFRAQPD